ncbi:MAG: hypothetical protein A2X86_08265 [Bdellovibrionales bacterium GWA2_49_15]|nr:MAG: hypothetical protein A2X86_08265 [Bdellovibrionales bacterium GWA2_49_15]HAZ11245.1 hypothetical protein [Bdellovibrionales bacterium]
MKNALLHILLLTSLPVFAQTVSAEDTYRCRYSAFLGYETFTENFLLGDELGFVTFDKELNGQAHFFDFRIFKDQDMYQFEHMEGLNIPISAFYTRFSKGEESISAGSFYCAGDRPCWNIRCTLNK